MGMARTLALIALQAGAEVTLPVLARIARSLAFAALTQVTIVVAARERAKAVAFAQQHGLHGACTLDEALAEVAHFRHKLEIDALRRPSKVAG